MALISEDGQFGSVSRNPPPRHPGIRHLAGDGQSGSGGEFVRMDSHTLRLNGEVLIDGFNQCADPAEFFLAADLVGGRDAATGHPPGRLGEQGSLISPERTGSASG